MKVFLPVLALVALCVLGLCFNIIFRKNGQFPQYDVGSNEQMRRMGIKCMKEVQEEINLSEGGKTCSGNYSEACKSCGLYKSE